MTLEEFAQGAGVRICHCDSEWGGNFAYTTTDHPNSTVNGFKTKKAAYVDWLEDMFGKTTGQAVLKLLKEEGK